MRTAVHRAMLAVALATASGAQAADDEAKRLFNGGVMPACMLCHALKAAGSEGAVGPSLDELKPDAQRVAKALKNGIGQMPAFPQLTEAQIAALSRYVEQATR